MTEYEEVISEAEVGDLLLLTISMIGKGSRLRNFPFNHKVEDLHYQGEEVGGEGVRLP